MSGKGVLSQGRSIVVGGAGRLFFRGFTTCILKRADPLVVCTFLSLAIITVCKGCVLLMIDMSVVIASVFGKVGTDVKGLVTRKGGSGVLSFFERCAMDHC